MIIKVLIRLRNNSIVELAVHKVTESILLPGNRTAILMPYMIDGMHYYLEI